MNQNALEEARSLLEQTDKNRRMVEQVPTFFMPLLVHLESTGAGGHEREPERPDLSEPGDPGGQDEVRAGGERDEPRPRRDEIRGGYVRGEGHQVQ